MAGEQAEEEAMGEISGDRVDLDQGSVDDDEHEQALNDLREFHELENMKAFVEEENGRLKSSLDSLTGELEGLNIAVSSAEIEAVALENEIKRSEKKIEDLKLKTAARETALSNFHLRIKVASEDVEASSNLQEALANKLDDIVGEKTILIKRLNDMKAGLQTISKEKSGKLPYLKRYHSVLKQIHRAFVETQNRMTVSMLLRKR